MKSFSPSKIVGAVALLGAMSVGAASQGPPAQSADLKPTVTQASCSIGSSAKLDTQWGLTALSRESDYISNCSYTKYAANGNCASPNSDAYGAINDVRIGDRGPDWVVTGEGAEGAIGLMAAVQQMRIAKYPTDKYDTVLDSYFDQWLFKKRQAWDLNPSSPNCGGVASRVYYDAKGHWQRNDGPTTASTGMIISVMWKRYEYLQAVGRTAEAKHWLTVTWPLAKLGGDFIFRNYDATTQMVHGNSSPGDLWLTDAVLSVVGLRCLEKWSARIGADAGTADRTRYKTLDNNIVAGIEQMKDTTKWHNFYRFRDRSHNYAPSYGDCVDQLCFLPYEADVLSTSDPYAKEISDWWTCGCDNITMTPHIDNPNDWRFFGTHWHLFFANKPENHYLYPGPGLQLAKVEWKYAKSTSDAAILRRACNRLTWAARPQYSNLWLGESKTAADGVPSGIIDWRDANNYQNSAENWARFVDTSSYMIEAVLMVCFDKDTKYVPASN